MTWSKYEYPKGYKRQLEMYQWLFRKNGFQVSNKGYLVYYNGLKEEPMFNQTLKFELHVVAKPTYLNFFFAWRKNLLIVLALNDNFYTLYYKGEILLAVLKLLKLFYYLIFLSTQKEILNFLGGYDLFHK